jgi:hypothetical protein
MDHAEFVRAIFGTPYVEQHAAAMRNEPATSVSLFGVPSQPGTAPIVTSTGSTQPVETVTDEHGWSGQVFDASLLFGGES